MTGSADGISALSVISCGVSAAAILVKLQAAVATTAARSSPPSRLSSLIPSLPPLLAHTSAQSGLTGGYSGPELRPLKWNSPDACPDSGTRTIRATTYAAIFARFTRIAVAPLFDDLLSTLTNQPASLEAERMG